MPATKNTEPEKQDAPKEKPVQLADAGASSDPLVQKALADLEIAQRNNDEEAVKAAVASLTGLGVAL